ncbi:MAG: hypothetical protein ACREJB_12465, partial [Planctomycetaceae bacterium]
PARSGATRHGSVQRDKTCREAPKFSPALLARRSQLPYRVGTYGTLPTLQQGKAVMAGAPPPPGQEQGRGTLILILGILSIVVCPILGPFAWSMGKADLQKIDQGLISQQERGTTQAGYICGIIGTVLLVINILIAIVWIVILIAAVGAGAAGA